VQLDQVPGLDAVQPHLPVLPRLPVGGAQVRLDPGRVNGMAREVSLSGFSPVARLKIRP